LELAYRTECLGGDYCGQQCLRRTLLWHSGTCVGRGVRLAIVDTLRYKERPIRQAAEQKSAAIGSGGNARNVRTIKADIGQFAIAELGQFADIALIIPERLDHADERE
jgi:hypothetical protein